MSQLLELAISASYLLVSLGVIIALYKIIVSKCLVDKIVALDLVAGLFIAGACIAAVESGQTLYLDIAIGAGLVAFLATVAFSIRLKKGEA